MAKWLAGFLAGRRFPSPRHLDPKERKARLLLRYLSVFSLSITRRDEMCQFEGTMERPIKRTEKWCQRERASPNWLWYLEETRGAWLWLLLRLIIRQRRERAGQSSALSLFSGRTQTPAIFKSALSSNDQAILVNSYLIGAHMSFVSVNATTSWTECLSSIMIWLDSYFQLSIHCFLPLPRDKLVVKAYATLVHKAYKNLQYILKFNIVRMLE